VNPADKRALLGLGVAALLVVTGCGTKTVETNRSAGDQAPSGTVSEAAPPPHPPPPPPPPTAENPTDALGKCQTAENTVLRVNGSTSCSFAVKVASAAFAKMNGDFAYRAIRVRVSSPVTGQMYSMLCETSTDAETYANGTCTGGQNAYLEFGVQLGKSSHKAPPTSRRSAQPPALKTFSCPAKPRTNEVDPPTGTTCAVALRVASMCVLQRVSAPGWICAYRPGTNRAVLAEVRNAEHPQALITVYDGSWGE